MVILKLLSLDRNSDFRKGKVSLKADNKESNNEGVGVEILITPGDYTLGRGQFLKCFDQRVSRKHAKLMVTLDKATLQSTHINPCFFSSAGSKTVVTLKKDMLQELKDGDRFSLLPSEFWYKVCLLNTDNEDQDSDINEVKPDIPETSPEVGSTTEDGPPSSSVVLPEETNNCQQAASSTPISSKRKNSEGQSAEPSSKHPRLIEEEEIKEENPEHSMEAAEMSEEDNIVLHVVSSESNEKSMEEEQETVQPAEEQHQVSINFFNAPAEEDRESNKLCNEDSTRDNVFPNETTLNVCNVTDEDRKTPILNNVDVNNVPVTLKERKCSILNNNDDVNNIPNVASNQNVVNDGAGPSSSGPRRERCWFAETCYRKHPSHKTDFSHPGDDDYDSDPNDSRPICSYGLSCYRRNLLHRRQYRHLAPPAPRPNQDKRKRKRKATTRVTNYKDDTPEDDYDYDDPFLNDGSSDDYEEESDFSMSDSESDDDSQATEDSEDVRRLLKEAKKLKKK